MKNILNIILAAIIGAGASITTIKYFNPHKDTKSVKFEQKSIQPQQNNHLAQYIPTNGAGQNLDFTVASEKTINSVVHVRTEFKVAGNHYYFDPLDFLFGNGGVYQDQQPAMATGSGVIVSSDGYIVTNNHVIDKAEKIKIMLNNKKEYEASVIGKDPNTDLALLKIDATNLTFVPYGNSDVVKVGEWVLAVGNPFNLTSTVTAGIVSAKGRDINILGNDKTGHSVIESFIQTDAAVNPGNSGGALVNTNGELIGINTAIKSNTGSFTGYSFAIPVNIVKKVINDLLEFGLVQRAYIGVSIRDIDAGFAKENNFDILEGVYISGVTEDGAAKEAGIEKGDIITKIGNEDIKDVAQLQEQLGKFRPGDNVLVTVNRAGTERETSVTVTDKTGGTQMKKREFTELTAALGAQFEEASEEEKQKLRIEGGLKVMSLTSGKLRSAGIKEGFIITKVDKKVIGKYEDMALILENKKGGVLIEGVYRNGMKAFYGFGLN
jgi:serine protease Do